MCTIVPVMAFLVFLVFLVMQSVSEYRDIVSRYLKPTNPTRHLPLHYPL